MEPYKYTRNNNVYVNRSSKSKLKNYGCSIIIQITFIDFSKENLKPGTSSWLSTRNKVQSALEEYSCFEAVYDKVLPCKVLDPWKTQDV